jgi:hypothetical protein
MPYSTRTPPQHLGLHLPLSPLEISRNTETQEVQSQELIRSKFQDLDQQSKGVAVSSDFAFLLHAYIIEIQSTIDFLVSHEESERTTTSPMTATGMSNTPKSLTLGILHNASKQMQFDRILSG